MSWGAVAEAVQRKALVFIRVYRRRGVGRVEMTMDHHLKLRRDDILQATQLIHADTPRIEITDILTKLADEVV